MMPLCPAGPSCFRAVLLVTLTLSTSTTVLLLRLSRTHANGDSIPYLASTVVLLTEGVKFGLCLVILLGQHGWRVGWRRFREDILENRRETARLLIPAGLYAWQNNLLYTALTYLDSATYQVTYQLKILTTALFSAGLLGKQLHSRQWLALIILTLGVGFVQIDQSAEVSGPTIAKQTSSSAAVSDRLIGLVAVVCACFSSGLSGVYFEKLVKTSSQQSVMIRNLQLGLLSIPLTLVPILTQDFEAVMNGGFFQGYNKLTVTIIILQSLGGLLVAVVVKYADNILKGFATSFSIVLCSICSFYFIENTSSSPSSASPSGLFFTGSMLVIAATVLYSTKAATSPAKQRTLASASASASDQPMRHKKTNSKDFA